jgi:hypothetical protein
MNSASCLRTFVGVCMVSLFATCALAADNVAPPGFVALFNGKDLTGWKGLVANPPKRAKMAPEELAESQKKADDDMRAHWSVEDGVLIFDGKKLEGYNLCAAKDYGNFEMYVDWKIDAGGDSGIYLRGSPQVQIWDPSSKPAAGVGSGGLYNNQKNPKDPSVKADKPIGEWNTFHIKMVGDKVTVWLNDQLVVDNVTLENYWERNKPIYPVGQIELQSHSSKLNFKNIYIKELPPENSQAQSSEPADLPKAFIDGSGPGWVALGEADFQNVNCYPDTFTWKDDVCDCTGKPVGVERTKKVYTNFEMVAQWMHLRSGGNSGIFVWADPATIDSTPTGKYPKALELQVLDHGYTEQYEKSSGKKATWFTTNGDLIPVDGFKMTPFQPVSPDGSRSFPRKNLSKGVNEWNHYYVRCINGEVRLWVNGEEVSGCKDCPQRAGYVCLESEGAPVTFRHIRIRELP